MKITDATAMRDRPAIRALLKTPGPKTEAEVIKIIERAWIEGWKEGKETYFKKGFDAGKETERGWWQALGFSDAGRSVPKDKADAFFKAMMVRDRMDQS